MTAKNIEPVQWGNRAGIESDCRPLLILSTEQTKCPPEYHQRKYALKFKVVIVSVAIPSITQSVAPEGLTCIWFSKDVFVLSTGSFHSSGSIQ